MSNDDVVAMMKGGLSEALIVATIRQARRRSFLLTPEALIQLKEAGISENILTVMVDPTAQVPFSAPPPSPRTAGGELRHDDDPAAPHEAGIYVDVGKRDPELILLEPAVFSEMRTGGMFQYWLTEGLAKAQWKAVVRNRTANQRVHRLQPAFYFYFELKGAGLSNSAGWNGFISGASSPNEFVLARMTQKRSDRELIVGEWGKFGAGSGTRGKDTVPMRIERLRAGVYRVTPAEPLAVGGEYCFFHAAVGNPSLPAGAVGLGGGPPVGRLFDFGVDAEDVPPPDQ
jgi:hypothetical protein